MGEFKDASVWMQVAFICVVTGFIVDLFSYAEGVGVGVASDGTEACLIIGFLCFLAAVVLGVCAVFLDALKGNKPAIISFVVLALLAGLFTIIGVAIWGDALGGDPPAYSTMHSVLASFLAILAGVFAILDIAGVQAK